MPCKLYAVPRVVEWVSKHKTTDVHYKNSRGKHRKACALRAGGIASGVRMRSPWPAVEDLPSRPSPNLCGNCGMQALINRLRCNRAPSSRNSFGECAKNGDGTSVWSAVGAPYERRVFNILSLQSTQMWSVVFELPLDHGFGAIVSSVACIGRCDADV